MSNSTTLLDLISSTQANKEATANAMFDAASPSMLWGRRSSTTSGLTWGYYGGTYYPTAGAQSVANGAVTLTASTTNYVQASATTGAISVNTTGFTAGAIPLYSIVAGTTTVTSYTDVRSYQPAAVAASSSSGGTIKLAGGAVQTAAYTYIATDTGCTLVMNSATAVAQPLPTPTGSSGNFPNGWYGWVDNIGVGVVTLGVPTGEVLDGATNGSVALAQNTGLGYFTDGTNWYTVRGVAAGFAAQAANAVFAGPTSGASATPAFRALVAADLPLMGASGTGHAAGAVPDPGATAGTTRFLREDGTWDEPGAPAPVTTSTMDLISYLPGAPAASAMILRAITPQALTLVENLTGSYAVCDTAPTASITCTINRISSGTTTAIGSVNYAASATAGTFTFSAAVTTTPGDIIEVVAPSSADATFAGPCVALAGTTPVAAGVVNVQTGSYTLATSDRGNSVVMNDASANVLTLDTPTGTTGNFPDGWYCEFSNIGAGASTVTPPSGVSLDGVVNGTVVVNQFSGLRLTTDGSNWFTVRGSGVTSVGLTVPARQTVANSPITGAGTLEITDNTQAENLVFAGPASGAAAAPTFRALVAADVPAMGASGASHAAGIVPDPGATAGTLRYLREDGTWTAPPSTVIPINTQAAGYTLALTDQGGYVRMTSASANNATVPVSSTTLFPVGAQVHVRQAGAGTTTIVASAGVTINAPFGGTLVSAGQGATMTLVNVGTDVWDLIGGVGATT